MIGAIMNSIINGDEAPIQVQVMDTKTCFDKLLLEAVLNSLYENDMNNDK